MKLKGHEQSCGTIQLPSLVYLLDSLQGTSKRKVGASAPHGLRKVPILRTRGPHYVIVKPWNSATDRFKRLLQYL